MSDHAAGFTHLEAAVIAEALRSDGLSEDAIQRVISSARIIDRRNTGHGFYTDFETPEIEIGQGRRIDGPLAHMDDMGEGALMGFIIWCEPGEVITLEGYQYGDEKGATVDLLQRDLGTLRFNHLEL